MERTKDQQAPAPHQETKPLRLQHLALPIPGAFYNQADFKDVPFWTLQDWKDFLAAPSDSSSNQSISRRIGFLTDGNGNQIDKL